jgi:vacuolar-type H+-ATPase subunit F/Vma7
MSRLLVITRPALVKGFLLSGVEAYGAEDVESAQTLIDVWMQSDEVNLLAIDDGLYERMDPGFLNRLEAAENLPFLTIPGGQPLGAEASRKFRIAQMIRRAIGFHITFKGEQAPAER